MERTCLSAPSFPPRGGLSLIPSPKWPLVAEQVGHRAGREDGRPRHTSGRPGPRARPSALSLATPLPRQLLCEAVVPQRVSHRDGLAAGQLGACRQRWEREPGCETPWRAACPSAQRPRSRSHAFPAREAAVGPRSGAGSSRADPSWRP